MAITNVVPTLTTVKMATFCASCRKLEVVSNWPEAWIENAMMMNDHDAPNVTITGLLMSR